MYRAMREVEVALDEFAIEEVERVAGLLGVPRARLVQRAVRHWLDALRAGRLAARPPGERRPAPHPAVALAVDLAPDEWQAVNNEAESLDIEPAALVEHAVLLLLADVHSGRLAAGIARSPDANERKP